MPSTFVLLLTEAQGGVCPICGKGLHPNGATLEHVYPKSTNGRGRHDNHLATHKRCNAEKGSRQPTGCELIWLAAVNARLGPRAPAKKNSRALPPPMLEAVWPRARMS